MDWLASRPRGYGPRKKRENLLEEATWKGLKVAVQLAQAEALNFQIEKQDYFAARWRFAAAFTWKLLAVSV